MINLYPAIADGCNLHFYGQAGQASIITNRANTSTYYDQTQTDIIEMCNGQNTIQDICRMTMSLYGVAGDDNSSSETASSLICKLLDNLRLAGLIEMHAAPCSPGTCITGRRELFYPRKVFLELTNRCNLLCRHCFKNASSDNKRFLDYEIIKYLHTVLDGNTYEIQLTGGEPSLHPMIDDIVDLMAKRYYVTIVTNGISLDRISDRTLPSIGFVQISMYGYDEESYAMMTGNAAAFRKFQSTVQRCDNLG